MAAPSWTVNQTLHTSASLNGAATANDNLDLRTKFKADVQVKSTGGGTVAATHGLLVEVFRYVDGGTRKDTIPIQSTSIPTVVSTEKEFSFSLESGHYNVKFTNQDATNAITVDALYATLDAIS